MELTRISPHVYYSLPDPEVDRPVMGAVIGKKSTLVVEAGNSEAHARSFLQAMEQVGAPPPSFVAVTHSHWDHHFGATAFDAPVLATRQTMRLIREMTAMDWSDEAIEQRVQQGLEIAFSRDNIRRELPDRSNLTLRAPDVGFSAPLDLDLGDLSVQLAPVAGDHAPDSSVVWVAEDRILFLGDCHYPDIHHGPDRYTTRNLFPLLDLLLSFPAEYYLPAHQPDAIPRRQFEAWAGRMRQIGYLVDRLGSDREAIMTALPEPIDEETLEDVDAFLAGMQPLRPAQPD